MAFRAVILLLPFALAIVVGCESFPDLSGGSEAARSRNEEEATHRDQYIQEGDPEALRWLLSHAIEQGMTVADVEKVIGQDAVREYADGWIKNNGGTYTQEDAVWKWGPDAKGHSVYLVFREGQLVNYDPDEFLNSY